VDGVAGVTIDANNYGKEDPITGEFIPAVDGLLNFEWNEIPCAKYPQGIQINHLIRGGRGG
jgi:hypothetical protein